ncbi:MAG TPA: bifunctional pyr operon transcriptional regulator/uracil phosphoribosyltransferase PyrR [Opitutaceae bacterium]
MGTRKTIPATEIEAAFRSLAQAIASRHRDTFRLVLLGIARGGTSVCWRLASLLSGEFGNRPAVGTLNVAFHRDDIGRNPIPTFAGETVIPGDLEGATVILVDDVLFSGRTVRAALEEIFSCGRPGRVELAVLVDRGNRRLPFAADYIGFTEATTPEEMVRVALHPDDASQDLITIINPAA